MKFFQTLIASTLGVLIALFLVFIIFFITIISSTGEPEPYVRNNSVLKITFEGNIPARQVDNPFDELFNQNKGNKVSLETLRENLKKAATHDKIKGVWLNINYVSAGWANLEEAHRILTQFRDSTDKFIYASSNDLGYNEQGYFLATAADSIFSPAESFFEFDGFYSQVTFLTGLFDKIGIDPEVTRHGKYKSAVEPLYRKEMSDESEYQLSQILEDINNTFVSAVSQKTGKTHEEINGHLSDTPDLQAKSAYRNGLIDSLMYPDEVEAHIKKRIGVSENSELQTISNGRYARVRAESAGINVTSTGNKIAVIYAEGPITFQMDGNSPFDSQPYITASFFEEQLDDIREDEDIKALVVRINSPGGSGSTSDLIWRQLRETSKQMPVIASMGPVAASGGYYIAMAADSIVAEPTTITGSIGVFATKFNTKQLWNEELGVTFDEVKTHQYADWLDPTRGFTEAERKSYNRFVDRFYDTFITKVAEARGMTTEQVDEVAQGRVWTGADAKEQNLVDVIGGFEQAVAVAAEKAGIENYKLDVYPRKKDLFEVLMGGAESKVKSLLGESLWGSFVNEELYNKFNIYRHQKGEAMLIFPYDLNIQ